MKRILLVLGAALITGAVANAQMGEGRHMHEGMPGPMSMAGMMEGGGGVFEACRVDLDDLKLTPQVKMTLEEKRFDLRKKSIRGVADLRILRLEAQRLLEDRNFDLKAAEKLFADIAAKEAELKTAHLGFLHDLGAVMNDEQWAAIREEEGCGPKGHYEKFGPGTPMREGMSPMMPMMEERMRKHMGEHMGEHGDHHMDRGEAEKFFKSGD